jgi:hypothetical protein
MKGPREGHDDESEYMQGGVLKQSIFKVLRQNHGIEEYHDFFPGRFD